MILQGYFHDREKNSPKYREVWLQIIKIFSDTFSRFFQPKSLCCAKNHIYNLSSDHIFLNYRHIREADKSIGGNITKMEKGKWQVIF